MSGSPPPQISLDAGPAPAARPSSSMAILSQREDKNPHADHVGQTLMPLSGADYEESSVIDRLGPRSAQDTIEEARASQDPEVIKAIESVNEEYNRLNEWAKKTPEEAAKELGTNLTTGLTSEQVKEKVAEFGLNELQKEHQEPVWKIFLMQYSSPVVALLLVAAIVGSLPLHFSLARCTFKAALILSGISCVPRVGRGDCDFGDYHPERLPCHLHGEVGR